MNWRDCVVHRETSEGRSRFELPASDQGGFDCEAAFTISDVSGGLMWATTWPGDWVLSQEPLRTFFEIEGPTAIGATGSIFLFWIAVLIIGASTTNS